MEYFPDGQYNQVHHAYKTDLTPFYSFFLLIKNHFFLGITAIFGSADADRKIVCKKYNCVHKSIALSKRTDKDEMEWNNWVKFFPDIESF